ncbi:VanZ family protein [Paenibacillus kobensis]|uniref:VanZ family protein n=1 Tax=Paenibacillus kobensis TaxID=59841 RepID=UPI000FDC0694|nr:VanZ family protein [Paenibacillus kobensis]
MSIRERIERAFLYGVFICYLYLLMKILFLSRVPIVDLFNSHRTFVRSINLIPFHSISEYISGSTANLRRFAFGNVVGNIFIFIPLGVYLSIFKNNKRAISNLLFIFVVSFFVEVLQGLLGIGAADIDDIILNGLGGWIGILAYKGFQFILRGEKKAQTAITVLSAIVGLPVLYYFLFMIKMRY